MLAISAMAWETRTICSRQPSGRTGSPSLSCRLATRGEQVGVAGPLAVAVGGALEVVYAGLDGGDGVGHRARGVVLAVDAEPRASSAVDAQQVGQALAHLGDRPVIIDGQHAAVGVAHDDDLGAGLERGRGHAARCSRGRTGSRRRSARSRRRPAGPRRGRTRRCRGPSPGSPRRWCAAPARRAGCRTWRPGRRPGSAASSSARTCGSSSAATPALRVAPNATSTACRRSSSVRARAKNSVSLGIAPGQPPSMKPTPSSSSSRATASLSTTE